MYLIEVLYKQFSPLRVIFFRFLFSPRYMILTYSFLIHRMINILRIKPYSEALNL